MLEDGRLLSSLLIFAASAPLAGRLAFAGVFAALIIWLIFVPASRLGEQDTYRQWWRTSRFWAVLVAASQIAIYLLWR